MIWFQAMVRWLRPIFGRAGMVLWVLRHPTFPTSAKWLALAAVAYGLMPLDLVPDFIPALGQLDDAVLVPTLVLLALAKVINATLERYGYRMEGQGNGEPRQHAKAWSTQGPAMEADVRSADVAG